jgi:metallo-beta-lactamase family protein
MAATTLTFHGAGRTVTGSCMTFEAAGKQVMVDCGMFQGPKSLQQLNYEPFTFDPSKIDALLLTHAHIDHCGLIPKLVKHGFGGPIYCTEPTKDLLGFTLPDSGHIQESEVRRLNKRNSQRGWDEIEPIYTEADALQAIEQCVLIELEGWIALGNDVQARYWNAGHILGSASIEVSGAGVHGLFSGDIGPDEKAFHPDPEAPQGFDFVVSESTYGDRDKPDVANAKRRALLEAEVEAAMARGGNLIIPAFAIERTQELLLDLATLMNSGHLARHQIFIDSPLANKVTGVFRKHHADLEETGTHGDIFAHPAFHYVTTAEQSMRLNGMTGAIIISASGMCEAGRVRHHLKNNLWRSDSTILFCGYQGEGTLGRVIRDGAERVRIHGDEIAVRAQIRTLDHYSAHADQAELLRWIAERMPIHGALFLTHGEEKAMEVLAGHAEAQGVQHVIRPKIGERFDLAPGGRPRSMGGARALTPQTIHGDWHNAYAALEVELKSKLRDLPSDKARSEALARMRRVLDDYAQAR